MKLSCELLIVYGTGAAPGGCHSGGASGRRARALLMLTSRTADEGALSRPGCALLSVYTERHARRPQHYQLSHIRHVFTRHVDSGRATVVFRQPPHELHIRAECDALRAFVARLRQILTGTGGGGGENGAASSPSTSATAEKLPPPLSRARASDLAAAERCVRITSAEEYLRRRLSLPSGVQELSVSGLRLRRVEPALLARLSQLQRLDLSDNRLTIAPPLIARLPQLIQLNLSDNRLSRLDHPLIGLVAPSVESRLAVLNVSGNQLRVLPSSLARLRRLHTLNVANNRLAALPECLAHLPQLRALNASGNQLAWISRDFETASYLETLDMHANVPEAVSKRDTYSSADSNDTVASLGGRLTSLTDCVGCVPSLQCLSAAVVLALGAGAELLQCQRHLLPTCLLEFLYAHARCRQCARWCIWQSGACWMDGGVSVGSARASLAPGPLRHRRAALSHPQQGPLVLQELTCWWCCQRPGKRKRRRL